MNILFFCWIWADIMILALTLNSAVGFWYSSDMVFNKLKPEGHSGPLNDAAVNLIKDDPNLMLTRRAYALECWLNGPIAALGTAALPFMITATVVAYYVPLH
jgi:hypothetical protein